MAGPFGVTLAAGLVLSVGPALFTSPARADDGTAPAFAITKETNQNEVKYDVRVRPDCTIDTDDPLDIYWITRDDKGRTKREGLNFIEKGLYGFSVDKTDPHVLKGEVKALKSKGERFAVRIQVEPGRPPSTLVHSGQAVPGNQQAGIAGLGNASSSSGGRCVVKTFVDGPKLPEEVQVKSLRLKQFEGRNPHAIGIDGTASSTRKPRSYTVRIG